MKKLILVFVLMAFAATSACASVLDDLQTDFEKTAPNYPTSSGSAPWAKSSQATEWVKICAQNSGGRIRYETMGHSATGIPIPLAIVSYPSAPNNPSDVGNRSKLWILGSMHGNEPSGTEGILWFLREAAQGKHDEMLKNVVVFFNPVFNVGGRDNNRRDDMSYDINRDFTKMDTPNVVNLLKGHRKWHPHILVDLHHASGQGDRHLQTFNIGRGTNVHDDVYEYNQAFLDHVFGMGIGQYGGYGPNSAAVQAANFYMKHMQWLRTNAPVPVFSSSGATTVAFNSKISDHCVPYLGGFSASYLFDDVISNDRQMTRITHINPDNSRTTFAYMTAKGRFGILYEVPASNLRPYGLAHAHYASVGSTVYQASIEANDMVAFFNSKDTEFVGKTTTDGSVPLSLGELDVRTGVYAGNWDYTPSPSSALNPHDFGWGAGKYRIDGYRLSGTGNNPTVNRAADTDLRSFLPNIWNHNVPDPGEAHSQHSARPRYPLSIRTQMGAFYIFDGKAAKAAEGLMRHGLAVSKLTRDVTIPSGAFSFVNMGREDRYWGISPHYGTGSGSRLNPNPYEGHVATRIEVGDWHPHDNYVAKAGSYVLSTAQPYGRFGAFWVEPKANDGAFLWNFFDDALDKKLELFSQEGNLPGRHGGASGEPIGTLADLTPAFIDIAKVYSYSAIPADALVSVALAEDSNEKPDDAFDPPYGDFAGLTDDKATVVNATQDGKNGDVTITIKDACLHDGMWLTFFFYDKNSAIDKPAAAVLQQVFATNTPGTYEAVFTCSELEEAGLKPKTVYAVHYSNEWGDIFGFGTFTKGNFTFEIKESWRDIIGCDAGLGFGIAGLIAVFMFLRKRSK
ncbi:MAG: hypothetical protein FWF87_00980 [Synergistaceae bacterium]|nr:hypothetical protein [Synergistaceae bacterium]